MCRDLPLLAKLEGGDLIALEAKYHLNCLAKLRNCYQSHIWGNQDASSKIHKQMKLEARAFAELMAYIESSVEEGNFYLNCVIFLRAT